MSKYFKVEEANQLLPVIESELIKLKEIKTDFENKYQLLQQQKKEMPANKQSPNQEDPLFELEAQIDFLQMEAQTHMNNIQDKGILLKDIELGLIDFPALIQGQEVLLCWKLDEEKEIKYYHGLSEGYIGRKPI